MTTDRSNYFTKIQRYLVHIKTKKITIKTIKMNKQEFRTKAHQRVEQLISEYEKLETKKNELSSEMKEKYNAQMENLRKRRVDLENKLKKLDESQEVNINWEETKEIFNKSLEHYKNGFAELGKIFKR